MTRLSLAQTAPYIVILGVAQDAGHPQAGCQKHCCADAWNDPSLGHLITSIGIVDPESKQTWLLDASPDLPAQWATLNQSFGQPASHPMSGVLLTHAHIGHYTGLMYLGREAAGTKKLPVYGMPRMREFLSTNGPWEQLVSLNNIHMVPLTHSAPVALNARISATPLLVPHRDEYSETVGFIISGPNRRILYLPDVDKWERMNTPIESLIASVDYAFLDGTFFTDDELPGRAMSEIPHPFITESLSRFSKLPVEERKKIHFIHFNHTNPVLRPRSQELQRVLDAGLNIAQENTHHDL